MVDGAEGLPFPGLITMIEIGLVRKIRGYQAAERYIFRFCLLARK